MVRRHIMIDFKDTYLGLELGSTRVKAVLTDKSSAVLAVGEYEWENRLENGLWTYSLDDIHAAVKGCYKDLADKVYEKYGARPDTFGAMGISAMMHGYMAFDESGKLLAPFRTWRNTNTAAAAGELTKLLGFNIPQRWSISHLYQAIIDKENHVSEIAYISTLAVYVHQLLTGVRAAGIGDASGMFPIGSDGKNYDKEYTEKVEKLFSEHGFERSLAQLLPQPMQAGEKCGNLTKEGAAFLDESGTLREGVVFCPPEGDAGTGMAATNSVRSGTGNVSAGTSVFSMLVLEKPLKGCYPEIDVVTAPDGKPVAMVHCNNCCGEVDFWVKMFGEFAKILGSDITKTQLYEILYTKALTASADCAGITAFNFISDEPVANVYGGRPAYTRESGSRADIGTFFRAQIYAALAALKMGNDILTKKENISAKLFNGHGGLFKAAGAAQQFLADGLSTPVAVSQTAGEGGAWGMALLARYTAQGKENSLADWLDEAVFKGSEVCIKYPEDEGKAGFEKFMERYKEMIGKGAE